MTNLIRIYTLTVNHILQTSSVGFEHTDADACSAIPDIHTQYFFPCVLGYKAWCEICCLKSDFASLLLQAARCAQDVILLLAPIQLSPAPAPVPCQSQVQPTLKSFGEFRDVGGAQWISLPLRDSGLVVWLPFMPAWGTVCCLMRSAASTSSWWGWYWQETTSTKGNKPCFGHAQRELFSFLVFLRAGFAKHSPCLAPSKAMGISDSTGGNASVRVLHRSPCQKQLSGGC